MKHYTVDYNKFVTLCYKILKDVRSENKSYQAILCPLKGGFFLSYFMARHLKLPIHYMEISSYQGKDQLEFELGHLPELQAGHFLLCDDIYDSGNTINKIKTLYSQLKIDIACLISRQEIDAFYYGEYIDHDSWVDFFWEII